MSTPSSIALPDAVGATGPACGDEPSGQVVRTLIDEFLADQADTTAVERFSRTHDAAEHDAPLQTRYYRDLMPATPPGPGQQYAFEVDLDACSGCKACVVACTSLNGLPDGTSFRSTGTLIGGAPDQLPVLRTVTTACHHCVDPGCLNGCPANAYEKDPDTGVVRHLDDQCIGCQYCTLTCPYEVPTYDADRGIVRKCDLCHDRLADGEAPACVQACPTHAIAVRIVDIDAAVTDAHQPWSFPSPDPATTVPTTRYRTTEDLVTGVHAADRDALSPAHAHTPLAIMLVLTQVAVGTLVTLLAISSMSDGGVMGITTAPAALTALGTAVVALGASVFHVGRPLQAWRAVLGVRHSWMSREIIAFGVFAPSATAYAAAVAGWGPLAPFAGQLGLLAAGSGVAGVATSVMIYAVTGRRWWSAPRVAGRFALTAVLGGVATLLALVLTVAATTTATGASGTSGASGAVADLARVLATALTATTFVALAAEVALLRRHTGPLDDDLARTARLLTRHLARAVVWRAGLLLAGGAAAPWLAWRMLTVEPTSPTAAAVTTLLGLSAVVAAELIERWRFFTAVAPTRMPGRLP